MKTMASVFYTSKTTICTCETICLNAVFWGVISYMPYHASKL